MIPCDRAALVVIGNTNYISCVNTSCFTVNLSSFTDKPNTKPGYTREKASQIIRTPPRERGGDQKGKRSLQVHVRHKAYGPKVDKENQPSEKLSDDPKDTQEGQCLRPSITPRLDTINVWSQPIS